MIGERRREGRVVHPDDREYDARHAATRCGRHWTRGAVLRAGAAVVVLSLAAVLASSGCYLSHGASDAERDAGAACEESKLRTSGLVEPWAPGSFCDVLVACVGTSAAMDAARASFPELTCRDAIDPVCVGVAPTSCSVRVGTLSNADYHAACALTLRSDVAALVCSGDL